MLYSVTPPEDVWNPQGPASGPLLLWRRHGSRMLCLRLLADGQAQVERLISTEPRDFLDPSFGPGAGWPVEGAPGR